MKIYFYIFLAIILSLNYIAHSQNNNKLEIINSNITVYDSSKNPDYRRLVDSVIFKHDNAIMKCDSAWHYFKKNEFQAFGNIHINHGDSITLTGEYLHYIGSKNKIIITRNIKLKDNTVFLKTNELHYNLKNKIASYYNGGNIITEKNNIYSLKSDYYTKSKTIYFKKDIVLKNPNYTTKCDTLKYNTEKEIAYFFGPTTITSKENIIYCENGWYDTKSDISQFNKNAYLWSDDQKLSGDSLYYNRNKGYGKAINNIEVLDTNNNFIAKGELAEYFERNDSSIITDNSLLIILMEDDSLFLHGDTIQGTKNKKNEKVLKVFNKVKFFSNDLKGKCYYLIYNLRDSIVNLYSNPILWTNNYQLTADIISLKLYNGIINSLKLKENSFIASKSEHYIYNQIKGKNMLGYFNKNKLKKINVFGNGQTLYVVVDNQKKITGINKVECSNMKIKIINNKIHSINFKEKPDGIFFPPDEIKEEKLDGFIWRESEKPENKKDIFLW